MTRYAFILLCVFCSGCLTLKGVEKHPAQSACGDATVSEETTLGIKTASNNKVQGNKAEIGDRNVGTKNQGNLMQQAEKIVNAGGQWPMVAYGLGVIALLFFHPGRWWAARLIRRRRRRKAEACA